MTSNLLERMKDNRKYCILCGRVKKEVSVHLFPKDASLKAKWAAYCSMEVHEIKSKHSLCAEHFVSSCFKKLKDCTRLKLGSIPSVGIQNENEEHSKQPRYRSCVLCGGSLDPNLRYHSFPRDVLNRSKWAAFCGMSIEHVKTGHKLCNKHFDPSCFDRKKKLLSNSIPSIIKIKQKLDALTEKHRNISNKSVNVNVSQDDNNLLSQRCDPQLELLSTTNVLQKLSETTKNTEVEESILLAKHNHSFAFDSTFDKLGESTPMETESILQSAGSINDIVTDSAASTTPAQNLMNVATPKTRHPKIRYLGDLKSPDLKVVTPRRLRKFYSVVREKLAGKTKVIRAAKQRERRMSHKLKNLQELITILKDKNMINADAAAHLECLPDFVKELSVRKNRATSTKYSTELRKIALTLHFYSPKAYLYARQICRNLLPAVSTLRRYYSRVLGDPGFTEEALQAIKMRAKTQPVVCNLVMDEISIRERLHLSNSDKKMYGIIDLGTGIEDNSDKDSEEIIMANKALVFMVVSLKEKWKVPIGYFLTRGLNTKTLASLIKRSLELLQDANCNVHSLTFDGAAVNVSMCKELGASLTYKEKFEPWFPHPDTKKKVYIFWDGCHMLKLIRNTFGEKGPLIDDEGREISWKYILRLNEYQKKESLNVANKLTNKHIDFKDSKMNVRLAAQTLSSSVSTALLYLKDVHDIEEFQGCAGTAKFCSVMNDAFDILNCRSKFSKKPKEFPVCENTIDKLKDFITQFENYCSKLRFKLTNKLIMQSDRKTGFLGFIISLSNLIPLYEDLCKEKHLGLSYLLSYKLSQDHLENFFSAIRSRGGHNNNPDAYQFMTAYKRLLVHHEVKAGLTSNCLEGNIKILEACDLKSSRADDFFDAGADINCNPYNDNYNGDLAADHILDHDYAPALFKLSAYVSDVVHYIGGYIVRQIEKQQDVCRICLQHLKSEYSNKSYMCDLVSKKSRGSLIHASQDVHAVCHAVETLFRENIQYIGNVKKFFRIIITKTFAMVSAKTFNTQKMQEHALGQELFNDHKTKLIRTIAEKYLKIRVHHQLQLMCQKEKFVRHKFTKLILHMHQ